MDNEILRKAVEIGSWMNLTRAQWLDMIVAPPPPGANIPSRLLNANEPLATGKAQAA